MLTIQLFDGDRLLKETKHPEHAQMFYREVYPQGGFIRFTARPGHLWVQVDHAIAPALVYLPEGSFDYRLPVKDEPQFLPPFAFQGEKHIVRAWLPSREQLEARRNLALNPADQRGDSLAYPHATANVETRNEAQFAARNVLDGYTISDGHGTWPYQTWGIWERKDAAITVDFGREVLVDELGFVLRADFPHDAHWVQGTVVFSDGSELQLSFDKTGEPQRFPISPRRIRWARLEQLIKSDDPSVFPALTAWELYGRDA